MTTTTETGKPVSEAPPTYRVRVLSEVRGDYPVGHDLVAEPGDHDAVVNPQGAAVVVLRRGRLGLKPAEFVWIDEPPDLPALRAARIEWAANRLLEAAAQNNLFLPGYLVQALVDLRRIVGPSGYMRCACEGCTSTIPAWWASPMCRPCTNEDCEHDEDEASP